MTGTATEIRAEAEARYASAQQRALAALEVWEAAGSPFTLDYPNGMEGIHPLLKALQDAESHADKLMKSLGKRASAGRPAGSASAPDRVDPPARVTKLKAVS